MDYSKFYTPPTIAAILIDQIDNFQPINAVDICCGSCNLLHAAKNKWPDIDLTGVDVTRCSFSDIITHCCDGREYVLDKNSDSYSLILANPPFVYMDKKGQYSALYDDLPKNFQDISRLEIEMLFANLKLLTDVSLLMIIMPSTFIEGSINTKYREYLSNNFKIDKVIRLPLDAFGSSKIKSYAIYITKKTNNKRTFLYNLIKRDNKYEIQKEALISSKDLLLGNWVGIKANTKCKLNIKRGNISSQMFKNSGTPILHTAKKAVNWFPSVRFIDHCPPNGIFVEEGDIIVSRIGASAGQWCLYKGESRVITDCLYRVKDFDGQVYKKIKNSYYNGIIRGVATSYITMEDFSNWYNSI